MAHYQIYAESDTTLYEKYPIRNTGIDQILELTKTNSGSRLDGEYQGNTYNSRILINFDGPQLTELSNSIGTGAIGATHRKFYLNLKNIYATDLPISYSLHASAVSETWDNGTGNYDDTPEARGGVSWLYKDNYDTANAWATSFPGNITGNGGTSQTTGGGTWYIPSTATQTFNNSSTDIRMDITEIVANWFSGAIINNGLILKQSYEDERNANTALKLKFFSKETHTIYAPRLEVVWDDHVNGGGTNIVPANSNGGPIVYFKNIEEKYPEGSRVRFQLGVRSKYPTKTYTTSSFYTTDERLPLTSSYAVCDAVTGETILDYDDVYTKISNDANGSYFNYWMNSLSPERYYKFKIRSRYSESEIKYFDNGYYFRVVR